MKIVHISCVKLIFRHRVLHKSTVNGATLLYYKYQVPVPVPVLKLGISMGSIRVFMGSSVWHGIELQCLIG